MCEKKIAVAIVTARDDADTSYADWIDLRQAFLRGDKTWLCRGVNIDLEAGRSRGLGMNAEFWSLVTHCLNTVADNHVEYQLRSLDLQTMKPDSVYVVNRSSLYGRGYVGDSPVNWIPPIVSSFELEKHPEASLSPYFNASRSRLTPLGCSDKNTALVLCMEDYLVMMDDCCLMSPGLVETAYNVCERGNILLVGHRKVNLPDKSNNTLRYTESNWTQDGGRHVFGIWAMPLKYMHAVNGFNTSLDGSRGTLDIELKSRMDIYAKMKGIEYEIHESARVYEIDHSFPWGCDCSNEVQEVHGFKAPGVDIKSIHKSASEFINKNMDILVEDYYEEEEGTDE